jgi:hypothetical protein
MNIYCDQYQSFPYCGQYRGLLDIIPSNAPFEQVTSIQAGSIDNQDQPQSDININTQHFINQQNILDYENQIFDMDTSFHLNNQFQCDNMNIYGELYQSFPDFGQYKELIDIIPTNVLTDQRNIQNHKRRSEIYEDQLHLNKKSKYSTIDSKYENIERVQLHESAEINEVFNQVQAVDSISDKEVIDGFTPKKVRKICKHNKIIDNCGICYSCDHGILKRNCRICTGCIHKRVKYTCRKCNICDHGISKFICSHKDCSGCEHNNLKRQCTDEKCSGCQHKTLKRHCLDCNRCEQHGVHKHRCKECKKLRQFKKQ